MSAPAPSISLVKGHWCAEIPLFDRGFAYGDGLFETILWREGFCPIGQLHVNRLIAGAKRLSISLDVTQLKNDILKISEKALDQGWPLGILKIWLTRGQGGRGYQPPSFQLQTSTLCLSLTPLDPAQRKTSPYLALVPSEHKLYPNPHLAGLKHLNRLDYVLAALNTPTQTDQQVLLLSIDNCVIETLHHNIFWVSNGQLWTPDLKDMGVEGVLKQLIAVRANDLNLLLNQGKGHLSDLMNADEVFIANSVRGIWPVQTLLNRSWANTGAITAQLSKMCEDYLSRRQEYTL